MSKLQQLLQQIDDKKDQTNHKDLESFFSSQKFYFAKCQFLSDSLAFSDLIVSPTQVDAILKHSFQTNTSSFSSSCSSLKQEILYTVTGYGKAFDFILSLIKEVPLEITEDKICKMHHLIFSDYECIPPDTYRTIEFQEPIFGYHSPAPDDLDHIMKHFADQFRSSSTTLHPIELSALMGKRFLDMHPFLEGNHRIAFLLMNLILLYHGYPIISIPVLQKEAFLSALHIARTSYDMDPLCILIAHLVLDCYHSSSNESLKSQ